MMTLNSNDLPLLAIEIAAFEGCVIDVMVNASPSLSLSLANTSSADVERQGTMNTSLTATGGLLVVGGGALLIVTATVAVAVMLTVVAYILLFLQWLDWPFRFAAVFCVLRRRSKLRLQSSCLNNMKMCAHCGGRFSLGVCKKTRLTNK